MAEFRTLRSCPACGSAHARQFLVGSTPLRRCWRCALIYAEKVGDPAAIYNDDYLTGESEYGPDTTDPIIAAIGAAAAARRFEIIESALGIGTVLDVGCGSGEGLEVARRRGWKGIGLEPVEASAARARARGLDVRTCSLTDAGLPRASFDVVVASHVLEHMVDPVKFLAELAHHARPGGLVAVEVPN